MAPDPSTRDQSRIRGRIDEDPGEVRVDGEGRPGGVPAPARSRGHRIYRSGGSIASPSGLRRHEAAVLVSMCFYKLISLTADKAKPQRRGFAGCPPSERAAGEERRRGGVPAIPGLGYRWRLCSHSAWVGDGRSRRIYRTRRDEVSGRVPLVARFSEHAGPGRSQNGLLG